MSTPVNMMLTILPEDTYTGVTRSPIQFTPDARGAIFYLVPDSQNSVEVSWQMILVEVDMATGREFSLGLIGPASSGGMPRRGCVYPSPLTAFITIGSPLAAYWMVHLVPSVQNASGRFSLSAQVIP